MREEVTVVGAGNVGASCTVRLADRGLAAVVVVDVVQRIPQGKELAPKLAEARTSAVEA